MIGDPRPSPYRLFPPEIECSIAAAVPDYFKKVYGHVETLLKWSNTNVDEFIAFDPIYGL